MTDEANDRVAVPQETLMGVVLPRLKEANHRYKKSTRIRARPADTGEIVVSTTSGGEETSNQAKDGDYVVENQTAAKEHYVVEGKVFGDRYQLIADIDGVWAEYEPRGKVIALQVSQALTEKLEVGTAFQIIAPWGSEQAVYEGDYFVCPLPDMIEIYRIGAQEFDETYTLDD